jgi:D-arabinose 1-dehydrogenase-like Zn-dependent alcohol dehydrogenase
MPETMQVAIVDAPGAEWKLIERPVPQPGPHEVLVRVHAGGLCFTDAWMASGTLSFREFPLVLGHEGVGEVVAVGPGVTQRQVGDRIGMPMIQKACGRCAYCRGNHPDSFVLAGNCASPVLTGVNSDGANSDYFLVDIEGTILLPEAISYEQAAPTLCSGYTVWAGLRRAAARPGATVAVVGIGALGHLALQFAKYAGYRVIAVTHSPEKADLARSLGADEVVTSGAELAAAGGADVIMHTANAHAPVIDAMSALHPWGTVVLMGIGTDDFPLPALGLTTHSQRVIGSAHNGLEYLAEALDIVAAGHVTTMVETFPKSEIAEAFRRFSAGDVRFKAVVTF